MKQVVSFDKLKLTNNQLDDNGHVGNRCDSFAYFCLLVCDGVTDITGRAANVTYCCYQANVQDKSQRHFCWTEKDRDREMFKNSSRALHSR